MSPVPAASRAVLSAATAFVAVCAALLLVPAWAAADSWIFPGPVAAEPHAEGVGVELSNGSVFVAGGDRSPSAPKAELFSSDGTAFSGAGQMIAERFFGAGDLLTDGEVLIAGGDGWNSSTEQPTPGQATAEVWNPAKNTFTATGPMSVARQAFTVTALPNGEALAVGGSTDYSSGAGSSTAELYNPATNDWTLTGSMSAGRLGQSATLLRDCRVLIVGDNPTAVTYNYVTGTFTAAGTEGSGFQRSYQTATLLANGEVLIAGGVNGGDVPLNTASVWNPATGTFTPTANNMSDAHSQGFAVRLPDGRVVVGGGLDKANLTTMSTAVDIYHPATNSWTAGSSMPEGAVSAEAEALTNGRVVVIGAGLDAQGTEVYTPAAGGAAVSPPAQDCSGLSSTGGTGGGTGGTGGGGTGGGGTGGSGGTGGTGGTGAKPAAPSVSNVKVTAATGGTITVKLTVTAGRLSVRAVVPSAGAKRHGHRRLLAYGSAAKSLASATTLTIRIRPTGSARTALKRAKHFRVILTIMLTSASRISVTKTVTRTVHAARSHH